MTVGVGRIIVDSFDEIARLGELAEQLQIRPRVMVRATTGVEAHTHEYIATAHEDQFGFSIADGSAAAALLACFQHSWLDLIGIHSHIGSQIFDAEAFEVAARRTLRLHADFAAQTGVELGELDLGGGSASPTPVPTPVHAAALAEDLRGSLLSNAHLGIRFRTCPSSQVAISGPSASRSTGRHSQARRAGRRRQPVWPPQSTAG